MPFERNYWNIRKISRVFRDRSLFTGGGGLLFFRKVVEKKYDPPLQHDKKIMTLPQRRVKKIVTLPLSLFFIFI